MSYQKKAQRVEAVQWDGSSESPIRDFIDTNARGLSYSFEDSEVKIQTEERELSTAANDWIINEGNGLTYTMTNDEFLAKFEEAR
jgi:hypothetical protein